MSDGISIRTIVTLFWVLLVIVIVGAGRWWPPASRFQDRLLKQWKPALVIAFIHLLGAVIGGVGLQFSSLGVFCEALIGLALAYEIAGYEPLPLAQAVIRRESWVEQLGASLGGALAVVMAAVMVGMFTSALTPILGETMGSSQGIASAFPQSALQSFFLLLAGAGIAEETTYRLILLSLFWRSTRRPWVAVILSSLLFAAYHLSPLDGLYLQYWQRPFTILAMSALMGIVMGYVFIKRGYETAVLGHTLGDWIPLLLSRVG